MILSRFKEVPMRLSDHPSSQQVPTVFGGKFVAEQHQDEMGLNLSSSDVVQFLTVSMLKEMLKSLRASLGLQ
jgi:hypothetical protein